MLVSTQSRSCGSLQKAKTNTSQTSSLEKEPPRRATPWRMLEHPWMVEMKGKKVNMAHFLKQVWDWKD
jgi:mitogen-activated protein kinase kinase